MTQYRLAPGATKAELSRDGFIEGRGDVRKGVIIETDDVGQNRAIKRAARAGHITQLDFRAPAGIGETRCEPCNWTGYPFQSICARCGGPTRRVK